MALATTAIIWLPTPIGHKSAERRRQVLSRTPTSSLDLRGGESREAYISRAVSDTDLRGYGDTIVAIILLTCAAAMATFQVHGYVRTHATARQVVSYVQSTTNLTALSPVGVHPEAADFDATRPDGALVHVTVTWLPVSSHTFGTGTHLPANVKPFTVEVRAKDPAMDSDGS